MYNPCTQFLNIGVVRSGNGKFTLHSKLFWFWGVPPVVHCYAGLGIDCSRSSLVHKSVGYNFVHNAHISECPSLSLSSSIDIFVCSLSDGLDWLMVCFE